MRPTVYNRVLIFLSFAGIFVSGVLSLADYLKKDAPCGPSHGCQMVAEAASSHLLGVPNAYIGLLGYFVLAFLACYRELAGVGGKLGRNSVFVGYGCAAIGTLTSIYLTYISITVIGATCPWCLSSAVIMTLTLFTYMVLGSDIDKASAEPPKDRIGVVLVPVLAFLSIAGVFAASKGMTEMHSDSWQAKADDEANLAGKDAHILNPNGVVTLIEFGDLDCPNCKNLYPQIEQLVANSNGKLRYVFHHFPLFMNPEHPGALPGAVIAEMAAENGDFWKYLQMVCERPGDPHSPEPSADDMIKFGVRLGLKEDVMRSRIVDKNDPARMRVQKDLDLAGEYKVKFTPTFIIMAKGQNVVEVPGSDVFKVLDRPEYKSLLGGN